MIVTGAFLAEEAGVEDAKLWVKGGVVDTWTVGEKDRRAGVWLAILLQGRQDDEDWQIHVDLHSPTGSSGRVATLTKANVAPSQGENRFILVPAMITFQNAGRHVFVVAAEEHPDTAVTVPLEVIVDPTL